LTQYSFKKEASVYVVYAGLQYLLDISDITFNQTFIEKSYSTKTIQTQNLFESSTITKANPANFSFTIPMLQQDDLRIVFDRALDYQTFDLYIETQQDVFKIEICVITNATFIMERNLPLTLSVEGQASKLTRAGTAGVFTIPGTIQTRDVSRTYNRLSDLKVTLHTGTSSEEIISTDLVSLTVELQNNIKWTPFVIISGICATTPVVTLMYPTTFTISKRVLSGTVTRYLTIVNNTELQNWNIDTPIRVEAGQKIASVLHGLDLNMTNCSFTNRVGTGEIFTHSYDWRMTQNPSNLSSIMTYTTTSTVEGAILDTLGANILDTLGQVILEV